MKLKVASILLLVNSSICLSAQDTLFFDTNNPDDTSVEEVYSINDLILGGKYTLEVEGTYSIWNASFLTNPCCFIETSPTFPSPNVSINGNVGADIEYFFSLPEGTRCAGQTFPIIAFPTPRFEISLDSGQSWYDPQTSTP